MTRTTFRYALSISAALFLCLCLLAGAANAQDQPATATPDTGLTDPALLSLVGLWTGTYTMGGESGLAELEWKPALSGQWLQGTLRFWRGQDKNTLVYDEFIFLRPTGPGAYKGSTVDNFGVVQVAEGTAKDGIWQWTWEYDDGHLETGVMITSKPDKATYEGNVVDKDGNPTGAFTFDLTRAR